MENKNDVFVNPELEERMLMGKARLRERGINSTQTLMGCVNQEDPFTVTVNTHVLNGCIDDYGNRENLIPVMRELREKSEVFEIENLALELNNYIVCSSLKPSLENFPVLVNHSHSAMSYLQSRLK